MAEVERFKKTKNGVDNEIVLFYNDGMFYLELHVDGKKEKMLYPPKNKNLEYLRGYCQNILMKEVLKN